MFDLGRTLLAAVERRPQAPAITDGAVRFTYHEWFEQTQAVANGLETLGLARGDRLLVVMQNRWQMAALHWACQFAGIIVTPLNWRSKAEEIDYCIADAEAKAVAYDASCAEAMAQCREVGDLPRIVTDDVSADGAQSFSALAAHAPSKLILRSEADDWSLMLYTSGTSGRPKGVPRRHRAERAAALAHVAQNLYRQDECTLGVMPLYHTMGVRSLLAMAVIDGHFVCIPRFDPAATIRAIESAGVTNLYLVPTLYHMLLEHADFSKERVASVTKIGFAGAPMSDGLMQRVAAAFQPELFVNHYGSSEVYTYTIDQQAARKPGSSGRAALNQRIRVVPIGAESPDTSAAVGEEGAIVADMAGDEAFEGYWKRPEADAKSLKDGWFFTGDTGYFDTEGDLFVTGRLDDLIITGGENVSPVDVENALSTHPAVAEVAVAGLEDEQWGKIVTAFIKRREAVDEQTLQEHCLSSGLANFKRPRRYVFVEEIPKSAVGKVLRRELVAERYVVEGATTPS
ncbi:AMP-dependent synthetase and ligase [Salinisphaera dokdonensis CL-ES53]|uniref:AMP-dependent synthetase and ligase n=1 Tax=Salinisphaera dokdonensis CL-ES53 TaxID=1304272 RepID=A0ABV2AZX9_9GAMM